MKPLSYRLPLAAMLLLGSAAIVPAAMHYVDLNSTNSTPPYTNWTNAATNIQDAVDAAMVGDEVVVTNGIYVTGGRNGNRVEVDMPIALRSVNGPQFTFIRGAAFPSPTRCVYLTNGATLSGFTLNSGGTRGNGGGLFCPSQAAVVSNCVVSGNSALRQGGGVYGGTLKNCTLLNNSTGKIIGTGPIQSPFGGGACYSVLDNCTLTDNSAQGSESAFGGGAYLCTLNNCVLTGNWVGVNLVSGPGSVSFSSSVSGGGVYECTLNNCTLTGNSATGYYFSGWVFCGIVYPTPSRCYITVSIVASGGGAYESTLNNCISFGNSPDGDSGSPGSLVGNNWVGDPLFVDTNAWSDLRLQSNSPCINAGNNAFAPGSIDPDGNPRIAGGTVDIGAYESQAPVSQISYAWLQQYGLPINSSTDTADPDGDGVDNYHEWLAHSDPTNPFSFPPSLTLIPYGPYVILTWPTNAAGFTVQSTTNLGSTAVWTTNSLAPIVIVDQNVMVSPVSGPQQFYRLIH